MIINYLENCLKLLKNTYKESIFNIKARKKDKDFPLSLEMFKENFKFTKQSPSLDYDMKRIIIIIIIIL